MAQVWSTMEKTEAGRYVESGFHTTEPEKWYRCFTVDDPDEFTAHMLRFHSIPKAPLSRDEYEKICGEFGVTPASESDLEFFGTTFSSIGTNSYQFHTDPENRDLVVANTLHGLRYKEIKKSLK